DLKRRHDRLRTLRVGDVEKHRAVSAAGHDVESVRNRADRNRMAADVMPIQLHDPGDRLQVRAVVPPRHRNHHRVVLPARSTEISGGGDLEHVAVTLVVVEDSSVRHTCRPRGEYVAAIASLNREVTFSQGKRNLTATQAFARTT